MAAPAIIPVIKVLVKFLPKLLGKKAIKGAAKKTLKKAVKKGASNFLKKNLKSGFKRGVSRLGKSLFGGGKEPGSIGIKDSAIDWLMDTQKDVIESNTPEGLGQSAILKASDSLREFATKEDLPKVKPPKPLTKFPVKPSIEFKEVPKDDKLEKEVEDLKNSDIKSNTPEGLGQSAILKVSDSLREFATKEDLPKVKPPKPLTKFPVKPSIEFKEVPKDDKLEKEVEDLRSKVNSQVTKSPEPNTSLKDDKLGKEVEDLRSKVNSRETNTSLKDDKLEKEVEDLRSKVNSQETNTSLKEYLVEKEKTTLTNYFIPVIHLIDTVHNIQSSIVEDRNSYLEAQHKVETDRVETTREILRNLKDVEESNYSTAKRVEALYGSIDNFEAKTNYTLDSLLEMKQEDGKRYQNTIKKLTGSFLSTTGENKVETDRVETTREILRNLKDVEESNYSTAKRVEALYGSIDNFEAKTNYSLDSLLEMKQEDGKRYQNTIKKLTGSFLSTTKDNKELTVQAVNTSLQSSEETQANLIDSLAGRITDELQLIRDSQIAQQDEEDKKKKGLLPELLSSTKKMAENHETENNFLYDKFGGLASGLGQIAGLVVGTVMLIASGIKALWGGIKNKFANSALGRGIRWIRDKLGGKDEVSDIEDDSETDSAMEELTSLSESMMPSTIVPESNLKVEASSSVPDISYPEPVEVPKVEVKESKEVKVESREPKQDSQVINPLSPEGLATITTSSKTITKGKVTAESSSTSSTVVLPAIETVREVDRRPTFKYDERS